MAYAHRSTALVVENDEMQRTLVSLLLEESEMNVIECESAEAAEMVLQRRGDSRPADRCRDFLDRPRHDMGDRCCFPGCRNR